ncbi:hypothetical protein F3Y22_tig00000340pilonHSYRG00130 [Hibiscus syriacus]|uniref:Uncharacterized protein n=1 Tax=Hibiscus syriacus TaxID=106335 RepID=A0A6A3D103_HIBSY|nr:hypothetical protein F3Y22_tig00000340pilonHSYRG00130 [Hibiscus syriacus]
MGKCFSIQVSRWPKELDLIFGLGFTDAVTVTAHRSMAPEQSYKIAGGLGIGGRARDRPPPRPRSQSGPECDHVPVVSSRNYQAEPRPRRH